MVHHPAYYADLLKRKIQRYDVNCWLLNTGWVGGPYGIGKRISIRYTRAMLNAALDGKLNNVYISSDVPETIPSELKLEGVFVSIMYDMKMPPNLEEVLSKTVTTE